jgi:hypothetical protein
MNSAQVQRAFVSVLLLANSPAVATGLTNISPRAFDPTVSRAAAAQITPAREVDAAATDVTVTYWHLPPTPADYPILTVATLALAKRELGDTPDLADLEVALGKPQDNAHAALVVNIVYDSLTLRPNEIPTCVISQRGKLVKPLLSARARPVWAGVQHRSATYSFAPKSIDLDQRFAVVLRQI